MTAPALHILNGPNMNMLGQREPHIYGSTTLAELEAQCRERAEARGHEVAFHQSNSEAQIIDWIHGAIDGAAGIIINPGAFTHSSWAIHDALAAFEGPIIELHLSNPDAREPWRRTSVVAPVSTGSICGFGGAGYTLAVDAMAGALA